jgi:flagellar protein FlgJ
MEITDIGSAYLDNIRLSSVSAVNRSAGSGSLDFEEILKRAAVSQDNEELENTVSTPAKVISNHVNQPVDKTGKLYELCLELETFIIKNLLTGMRNTVQKSGLVDDSFAGKMYEDMLYDEYAKDFTKSANFGLAEQAYRQLTRFY